MDLNKIKEKGNEIKAKGIQYAEKGKNAAIGLAEKSKAQAQIVSEQTKLLKAERQLGALVYSLAKGNEENQPLVDKYIDMIASIEQKIDQLKASIAPAEKAEPAPEAEAPAEAEAEPAEEEPQPEAEPAPAPAPEEEPKAPKTCPQCGEEVADDALFCNKCGAQL